VWRGGGGLLIPTTSPLRDSNMMTEMAVDGGILELEEGESLISFVNNESLPSSPLQLRAGGEQQNQLSTPLLPQAIPETIIGHTKQSDGTVIVKVSTSTPHPNGFIDLKIEHYLLPPSSNYTSLDAVGEDCNTPIKLPIPNKYLTRVEYKTLTNNDDDDASTVYTALPPRRGDDISVASSYYTTNGTRRRRRKLNSSGSTKRCKTTPTLITIAILFVIVLVCVSVNKDWNKQEEEEEKKAAADIKKKGNDTDLPDNVPNMTEVMDNHQHHFDQNDVYILH